MSAVVKLDDIWHNDKLKQSGTEVASEGLHDPKKLRQLQE
jgi:hypothetical protein